MKSGEFFFQAAIGWTDKFFPLGLSFAFFLSFSSCLLESSGTGSIDVSTWGENFIEEQIPVSEEEGIVDGWELRYEKFLIVFREIFFSKDGEKKGGLNKPALVNLHAPKGEKKLILFENVEGGFYDFSYELGPAIQDLQARDEWGVTEMDVKLMQKEGFSIYIEGAAYKGDQKKTFRWGFKTATSYHDCEGLVGGKKTFGAVVTSGGKDAISLTIHGDHFFYDDLQDPSAKRRFEHFAYADRNGDNDVSLEELSVTYLVDLPPQMGPFGAGAYSAEIKTLAQYVEALSHTIGHFRGEGQCVSSAR